MCQDRWQFFSTSWFKNAGPWKRIGNKTISGTWENTGINFSGKCKMADF